MVPILFGVYTLKNSKYVCNESKKKRHFLLFSLKLATVAFKNETLASNAIISDTNDSEGGV